MKLLITHFLFCVCVVVHGAEGVLYAGKTDWQAQKQADNTFQVSYELCVALQLSGQTALSNQSLYGISSTPILLFLCSKGGANLLKRCQVFLYVCY